jgi:hypothetical protein
MLLSIIDGDFAGALVPLMIFAIPIVAIIGGITAGIVRTLSQHRLQELAARERIAAIERGVDPSKLPPAPQIVDDTLPYSYARDPQRRYQGLIIGGLVTLAVGVALAVMLRMFHTDDPNAWSVGLIPGFVGVALLLSAWIVKPRNGTAGGSYPPKA